MTDQQQACCLNCGRTEAQTPIATWRYQGRELQICAQCMPILIHETEQLLTSRPAANDPAQPHPMPGERDASR